jgi:hypothetical protein
MMPSYDLIYDKVTHIYDKSRFSYIKYARW